MKRRGVTGILLAAALAATTLPPLAPGRYSLQEPAWETPDRNHPALTRKKRKKRGHQRT
jgi:hypothetical protein